MDHKIQITAMVLTRNEGRNLRSCLESLTPFVKEIILLDSDSTDDTISIAKEFGCTIYNHPAATQASVYNWAMSEVPISTPWVMRVDADERWTAEGFKELEPLISNPELNGIYVNRKTYFMHQWIKYGGYYPIRLLLVWRTGTAQIENRLMDEHIFVSGKTYISSIDVIEANYDRQDNIGLWTQKHNSYSDRYAAQEILKEFKLIRFDSIKVDVNNSTTRKAWFRVNVYDHSPLFLRSFIYFLYRYFIQLGFLDGLRGFIYHFLQAFWFRFLIDVKIMQLHQNIAGDRDLVLPYLRDHFGMQVEGNNVFFKK